MRLLVSFLLPVLVGSCGDDDGSSMPPDTGTPAVDAGSAECRPAGDECVTSDDCCDGLSCLTMMSGTSGMDGGVSRRVCF